MKKEKKNSPLLNLLLIPLTLVIDVLIYAGGAMLDRAGLPEDAIDPGHAFPIYTLCAFGLILLFSLIMLIVMIVKIVKGYQKKNKSV